MRKLCLLLAMLMLLSMAVPSLAENEAQLLEGDWVHEDNSEYYLLFDGVDKFYYSTDESYYYGIYQYIGDDSFVLLNDVEEELMLTVNDDLSLSLLGVDGVFQCEYRYPLMDYPNTDEGTWLNDDGVTTLILDLYGEFELENDDVFYYGNYEYLGGGDYHLMDADNVEFTASYYDDGSIGIEGFDGYFWLQDVVTGDDPFEYVKADAEMFEEMFNLTPATSYDSDPIPRSGVWYKNGDASTIPFVLEDGVYSCENSVFGHEETGTWTLNEIATVLSDEETDAVAYISMKGDDGMPSGWDPIPMAGNRLLYSDAKDVYFLHESLIGTEEGEALCLMADFMRTDWLYAEEGTTIYLEFSCMGNAVICTTIDEDGESYQEIVGEWTLQDGSIAATYVTDETASYALPADSIVADGLEFTK